MLEMIMTIVENYPRPVLRSLMNHLGTHDTERVITLLAGERQNGRGREWQAVTKLSPEQREYGLRRMRVASAILYTLPGVPCIYYGDEVGVEGYRDPFNRATFPWGKEDQDLLQWYRDLGQMRGQCSCLTDGELIEFGSGGRTMGYIRRDEKDSLLCVFNAADHEIRFTVPREFIGGKPFMGTVLEGDELIIPRDGSAFIWAETPEEPIEREETAAQAAEREAAEKKAEEERKAAEAAQKAIEDAQQEQNVIEQ